ncbi:MAG TPA: hypothetical protein VHE99_08000 [Gammaproteobacteria bacterium]|nr:hypothetical protein [Gammaproteobacteria bacterium]
MNSGAQSVIETNSFWTAELARKTFFFISVYITSFLTFFRESQSVKDDIFVHIKMVSQVVNGELKIPHVGFQYTVYYINKLFHLSFNIAAFMLLALAFTFLAYIIFRLLKHFLEVSTSIGILSTTCLLLVSALYIPWFNKYIFLGQGSPNVWHNPTLIMVKPFAFLVTYLSILALDSKKLKHWVLVSILLLLSMAYKPSFGVVFIPAFFYFIVINHTKELTVYIKAGLAVFPSCLYALYQYYVMSYQFNNNPEQGAIQLSVFGVLHLFTHNVFISLLLATAFPLSLMLFRFKQFVSNKYLQLILIMFVIAYAQMGLLAETGRHFGDCNFFWGYLIVLQLLFVFSFIEFVKWVKTAKSQNILVKSEIGLVSIIFALHLFSGIYYFSRIVLLNNFR